MKIFRLLSLFLNLTLLMVGCGGGSSTSDYVKLANAAISRNASKLAKKHNMQAIGVGSGLHTNINMLGISFQISMPMKQAEARKLFVACMEEFLQDINSDGELLPYLSNYPFECKNIRLAIFIRNPDDSRVYEPYVGVVSSFLGEISFSYYDEKVEIGPYKFELDEPYEESLRIVKEQAPELLPSQ